MKTSGFIVAAIAVLVMCTYQMSTSASGLSGTLFNLTSGLPLTFLLSYSINSPFSITTWDRLFAKIIQSGIVDTSIIDFVYSTTGKYECGGFTNFTGIPLFPFVLGVWKGDSNGDFAGSYLCSKNCAGGICKEYQGVAPNPLSAYPFGCQCPVGGCGPNGPVFDPSFLPPTQVICEVNPLCDCGQIYPEGHSTQGYICSWWNIALNTSIKVQFGSSPELSPIRWCTCCANQ